VATVTRAVIFDAGDTLVRAIGGAWFPGHHYDRVLQAHGLVVSGDAIAACDTHGSYFGAEHHWCRDLDAERQQFAEFYRRMFATLGAEATDAVIEDMVAGMVDAVNAEPFPETVAVLNELRTRGVRLAVISDAWPSLHGKFRALGLRDFFDAFIVSADYGFFKPDARLFAAALEGLEVAPEEAIFVDDGPQNVNGAIALGIRGFVIRRDGESSLNRVEPAGDLPVIGNLREVLALVG
jgi:HAD superfamily hydrolase (TIGR01509 family)